MRRTNIYLDQEQLEALRRLGEQRGAPVAALVREAVEAWLQSQGVSVISEDEWQVRFAALLRRTGQRARRGGWAVDEVERDVAAAASEVRRARPARRR